MPICEYACMFTLFFNQKDPSIRAVQKGKGLSGQKGQSGKENENAETVILDDLRVPEARKWWGWVREVKDLGGH